MEKTVESKELLPKVSPLKEELKLKEEKLIGLENKFEVLEKELKDLRQDYKNAGTKEKEAAIQTWIEQQNKLINDNIEERKELRQEINKIQDKLGEIETKVLVGNEIERLKKENEELKKADKGQSFSNNGATTETKINWWWTALQIFLVLLFIAGNIWVYLGSKELSSNPKSFITTQLNATESGPVLAAAEIQGYSSFYTWLQSINVVILEIVFFIKAGEEFRRLIDVLKEKK